MCNLTEKEIKMYEFFLELNSPKALIAAANAGATCNIEKYNDADNDFIRNITDKEYESFIKKIRGK